MFLAYGIVELVLELWNLCALLSIFVQAADLPVFTTFGRRQVRLVAAPI